MTVQLCGKTFREKISFQTVTENRRSLCGSNVRWKTVPESAASSDESTIANSHQSPVLHTLLHCRMLPPGEFNDIVPFEIFVTITVTVFV